MTSRGLSSTINILQEPPRKMKTLRKMTMDYYLDEDLLYKRSFDWTLLKCLNKKKKGCAIITGNSPENLCHSYQQAYDDKANAEIWVLLVDYVNYVRKYHKYQIHGDTINAPLTLLFNMTSPQPFNMQGLDVIGSIDPKASNGHRFILVAINYFIKWVKTSSYMHVTHFYGQEAH